MAVLPAIGCGAGKYLWLYDCDGFFVGVIGVVPSTAVQLFPPAVRFSGLSFGYNVAYAVFGGLTPVLVSWLLPLDRKSLCIMWLR